MYHKNYVIAFIVVFLCIATSPFWLNFGTPEYTYPEIKLAKTAEGTKPIEDVAFMRAEHMALLNEWRDQALREGNRVYVASDGRKWDISLQNTCMECHTNYDTFCETCHVQNSVEPYCWTCHVKPQGK